MIDMKTNRRKYRTFSRHGDFLFTKREANKRNRKDAKKMLTNIAQYVIINISNEREVKLMLDKKFIKFLLIEGLCNGELEEDFQKDKNNLDKWVDMWYDEYIEKKER